MRRRGQGAESGWTPTGLRVRSWGERVGGAACQAWGGNALVGKLTQAIFSTSAFSYGFVSLE